MSFQYFSYQATVSFLLLLQLLIISYIAGDLNPKNDLLHRTKLPPCRACKVYVDSLLKGIDATKRNKFDGGDAAWEESKLSSYANSEVRLAEIQELLCTDVEEGKDQCYANNELWEPIVEEWWLTKATDHHIDQQLHVALCIQAAAVCCPQNHYGPTCLPCNNCGEHGRCAGDTTRKGNGQCHCDIGYAGLACETCASGHYESFRDQQTEVFLCSSCHIACAGNCTGSGATKCDACADGWRRTQGNECADIDECTEASPKRRCKLNQWCVNTVGSYECLACDASCAGCTGSGSNLCIRCGEGYELSGDICVDSHGEGRRRWVVITRYLTYFGLCLTTCIILQRSVWAAAVIGLTVAMYISVSEYVIHNPHQGAPNTTQLAEQFQHALPLH